MDPLARLRSFPKAPSPNDDPSAIRGNLSLEQKQLNVNILAQHVGEEKNVFEAEAIQGLKTVELNVRRRREGLGGKSPSVDGYEGEIICEINVTKGKDKV